MDEKEEVNDDGDHVAREERLVLMIFSFVTAHIQPFSCRSKSFSIAQRSEGRSLDTVLRSQGGVDPALASRNLNWGTTSGSWLVGSFNGR